LCLRWGGLRRGGRQIIDKPMLVGRVQRRDGRIIKEI
jgi:hypothetical protein